MLDEDIIKQIFFLSDKPRKDAVLADEVDIVQFAQNVASYVDLRARQAAHDRCVTIAKSHNRLVGELLEEYRP